MCIAFEKTKETVYGFIENEKKFTWDEVQNKVLENGGVLYVAPGVTLGQYMEFFEEKKILHYRERTQTFVFVSEIKKRMEKRLEAKRRARDMVRV